MSSEGGERTPDASYLSSRAWYTDVVVVNKEIFYGRDNYTNMIPGQSLCVCCRYWSYIRSIIPLTRYALPNTGSDLVRPTAHHLTIWACLTALP
jgi:hypothetical protein